jgi:nucleotide-binding universal stress UspA family protein
MGLMFLLIGLIPAVTTTALAFALLYGISYFFTEFGPNTTPGAFDRQELEQAAKDFLVEKVSAVAPTPKVPLLPLVAEGDPAEALVVAARDADLLVVGTRGRSPFLGSVLGAVGLRCAAGASCPVTLIKLPSEQPELPKEKPQIP